MRNSDRFINSFNTIEKAMKELANNESYTPFASLVGQLKSKNPVINKYENDLREFTELRNAIVHNYRDKEHAIAEPHETVVEQIEAIAEKLTRPVYVIPEFQRNVTAFQVTDSVTSVLKEINKNHYSQFPIYDGDKFFGLLNENGITSWIAGVHEEDVISINETTIGDIFKYQQHDNNFVFVSRDTSIYDAGEIFKKRLESGKRLDAILINETGKKNGGKLMGIITTADVVNIV